MEHAVFVRFDYDGDDLDPLYDLEDLLEETISAAGAGEFDGHEIEVGSSSEVTLFMYGPDADALFAVVRPVLASATCFTRAVATVRYGPEEEGVRSVEIPLGA